MPRPSSKTLALASLLLVLAVSACSNAYLPALLADPMAEYEPPGTELIIEESQPERHFPVTRLAHFIRTFRILDPDEADAVLEAAIAEAESTGWWMVEGENGCKNLDPGVGSLVITVQDRPPDVKLQIGLHYDRGSVSGGRSYEPFCPLLNS